MTRERALQVVMALMGLMFAGGGIFGLIDRGVTGYPEMIAGIVATLGVFLLLAVRAPSVNRSLIAFAAWSSLVHGTIMGIQSLQNVSPRPSLTADVLPLLIGGAVLLALLPRARAGAATAASSVT